MKIGLIGINKYAKHLNFACDLHAYAFQQFLTHHGYSSVFLDYRPVDVANFNMRNPARDVEREYRDAVRRGAKDFQLSKLAELAMGYRTVEAERENRFDKFERFEQRYLEFTDEVYDSDVLEFEDPGFDCYVCVTDVIWQSFARHGFDRGFLLGSKAFEGKQKIAYAASRGAAKDFTPDHERLFLEYLSDIDAITVREKDFSEYIESISGYEAPMVLDPVLLQNADFWRAISVAPQEERYIVLYYVMERSADTIAMAVEYAKLHDLTIVELSDRPFKYGKVDDPNAKHVSRYDVSMEEWLGYLDKAEAVFTNSFHGCCFSLLFETPFYVGQRNGNKVPNFLATFGLDDRRFGPETHVKELPVEIDFATAKETLVKLRRESEALILNALTEAQDRFEAGIAKNTSKFDQRRRSLAYAFRYHSGQATQDVSIARRKSDEIKITRFKSGAAEYHYPGATLTNDARTQTENSRFKVPGKEFLGWTVRFRIDHQWFWCLEDGSFARSTVAGDDLEGRKLMVKAGETVPHIPVNHISMVVFVAQWSESSTSLLSKIRERIGLYRR